MPASRGRKTKPKSSRAVLVQKRATVAALKDKQTAIEPVNRDSKRKLTAIRKELKRLEKEISVAEKEQHEKRRNNA